MSGKQSIFACKDGANGCRTSLPNFAGECFDFHSVSPGRKDLPQQTRGRILHDFSQHTFFEELTTASRKRHLRLPNSLWI